MCSRKLAPIVLFVYNRPWHTQQTIKALQKNDLASDSELFIYSDGAKCDKSNPSVAEVRRYLNELTGFKKITILERDENWGLANSIIDGVTTVVNKYGRVIVLEDDLVTSPFFLRYMNDALDFYKDEKKVMHISAWNYPISFSTDNDVFLYRVMDCWGWGTWKESWSAFKKDTDKLISSFTEKDISCFNLDGSNNVWKQVLQNKNKKINTWAIYWYASIFVNHGLCLNPVESFVRNIGYDGSGTHCNNSSYKDNLILNRNCQIKFTNKIKEDEKIVLQIKQFFRDKYKNIFARLINKLIQIAKRKYIR